MIPPQVQTYQLIASNGKPIRKATKVVFENGKEIATDLQRSVDVILEGGDDGQRPHADQVWLSRTLC